MKKNNKKGFILAETIAVSVIIMTSLVIVYTQFVTLNNNYKSSFNYDNVNNLYLVNNLRDFIKNDGLDRLIQLVDNREYVDITSCPNYIFDEYLYCRLLVDNSNIKTVLFTKEDISELKNSIEDTNYSQEMKNYVKKINNSTENSQRLIVEFNDETYATLLFSKNDNFTYKNFSFTGSEQTFVVPQSGYYLLETWGAQGDETAYGGYSLGYVYLDKNDVLYVNVGGRGEYGENGGTGGYNGGGIGSRNIGYVTGGGGATHIATKSGVLSSLSDEIDSILIVSGGGGGRDVYNNRSGAAGGGYIGNSSSQTAGGGTQTAGGTGTYSAGTFGQGGSKTYNQHSTGGGGGGFYGGGCSTNLAGGGGSGYIGNVSLINKAMYCYNCKTSSDSQTLTNSTTNVSEEAISKYAKKGHGYAKITYIGTEI